MSKRLEWIIASCVLFSSPVTESPAHADSPSRQSVCGTAQDCYQIGAEKYGRGEYQAALILFQESYRQTKDRQARTTLLYNIGSTYAILREPEMAREYFSLYFAGTRDAIERKNIKTTIDAMSLYMEGKEQYAKRNYAAALETFKRVYERMAQTKNFRSVLLLEIGQTYEKVGKRKLAADYYALYLDEAGDKAQERKEIEEKIRNLKAEENRTEENRAGEKGALLEPVPPHAAAELPAKPAEVEAIAGSAPSLPEKSFLQKHSWSISAGAIGVASLLGGLTAGYLASSKYDDLKNSCGRTGGCPDEDVDGVGTLATMANALYVTAGIAAIAAGTLYWRENSPTRKSAPSSSPSSSSSSFHFTPQGLEVKF